MRRLRFPLVLLAGAALALAAFGAGPLPALGPSAGMARSQGVIEGTAWLRFDNQTGSDAWIAVLYLDQERCDHWSAEGWWYAEPGKLTTTIPLTYTGDYYYYVKVEGHVTEAGSVSLASDVRARVAWSYGTFQNCMNEIPTWPHYMVHWVQLSDLWPGNSHMVTIWGSSCRQPPQPSEPGLASTRACH